MKEVNQAVEINSGSHPHKKISWDILQNILQVHVTIAKLRATMEKTVFNLVHKDMVVNVCGTYAVYSTQRGENLTILYPRAPVNFGEPCLEKYLCNFYYITKIMVFSKCY